MPSLGEAALSEARTIAAALIFLGSYVVFALGSFPGMRIDRPGAAIIGAVLMVAFGIVGAEEALAAIDFPTIVLLFSMMLIVSYVRAGGFFTWLTVAIVGRLRPAHLLPAVIATSGVLSAFLVNDVVCLVLTPIVVRVARRLSRTPVPYVLAVATASNIGSAATITGNPQNILIGSLSGIPYLEFLGRLGPVALAGLAANWAIVHLVWSDRTQPGGASALDEALPAVRLKPLVVLGLVLTGFLAGMPPALGAAVGAAVLLFTRTVDPQKVYGDVDWGLLVFFIGLFVIVAGAERGGVTAALLQPLLSAGLEHVAVLTGVTAAISNVVSNVPAVMLLRTVVPNLPDPPEAWLTLAMASTLAGNFTVTGSIANIIVLERAAADGVRISFREYLRVGVPVGLTTLALGALWLLATR